MTVNHDSLFHAKNSLVSVLKNKTTCGKETTRLNQNYVWTSADRAGRQVTLLIPPFLLVFLGIIAEGSLDGRKVLPQIIVLFSLYKVHANKKALWGGGGDRGVQTSRLPYLAIPAPAPFFLASSLLPFFDCEILCNVA